MSKKEISKEEERFMTKNVTSNKILVSNPLRPDSSEPTICIKVLVSRLSRKLM